MLPYQLFSWKRDNIVFKFFDDYIYFIAFYSSFAALTSVMSKVSFNNYSIVARFLIGKKCLMLEKSTCRSETVYWWKLVVEAANWSPFLPPVRIMFINILCFLTKNFELEENVVLLEVLYRHVECVDIYDFIHLLTYYQLCINFQKKKNLKMNSVQILWGFFVCVYKAKNMVHLMEEMPQSLELVPFFPPHILWECFVFFLYLIWKPLVTIQMIIIIVMLLTFIGCSTVF